MIPARNLYALQSKLAKNYKTIPIKTLEKDYVISWLLIGCAKSRLCDLVAFKGGTALKKFYFPGYRFSEDLDFTCRGDIAAESIEAMLPEIFASVLEASNITIILKKQEIHANGYTFFLNFSGPLGADLTRGEIKTDFTIHDKMINQPVRRTLLREYDEYRDIPEGITLKVNTLDEIFIEKYLSIVDAHRNEPRDMYDIWFLLSNAIVECTYLSSQIKDKGFHKGVTFFNILEALDRKEKNYRSLWRARLDGQIIDLPPFEKVYREIKRNLKPLNQECIA